MQPWQRMNHIGDTSPISRKDNLCRSLRTMRALYGSIYNFAPTTFLLPSEFAKFAHGIDDSKKTTWIFKVVLIL